MPAAAQCHIAGALGYLSGDANRLASASGRCWVAKVNIMPATNSQLFPDAHSATACFFMKDPDPRDSDGDGSPGNDAGDEGSGDHDYDNVPATEQGNEPDAADPDYQ